MSPAFVSFEVTNILCLPLSGHCLDQASPQAMFFNSCSGAVYVLRAGAFNKKKRSEDLYNWQLGSEKLKIRPNCFPPSAPFLSLNKITENLLICHKEFFFSTHIMCGAYPLVLYINNFLNAIHLSCNCIYIQYFLLIKKKQFHSLQCKPAGFGSLQP